MDTACIDLAGDDVVEAIAACGHAVRHFHISEPGLAGFSQPVIDHARAGAALRASDYQGFVSIEMRRQANPASSVHQAIAFARAHYA